MGYIPAEKAYFDQVEADDNASEAIEQLKAEYDEKLRALGCDFEAIDDLCQEKLNFVFNEWLLEQLREETVFANEVFILMLTRKGDTKDLIGNALEQVDWNELYEKKLKEASWDISE